MAYNSPSRLNNSNRHENTEYHRTLEVSKAPDTFPCGHVLCHHCIRDHCVTQRTRLLRCPICDERLHLNIPHAGTAVAYENDQSNGMLVSNFDCIVKKFNGINFNVRRLKEESVDSRSMAMTFTNLKCDMCREHHGTLRVLQEFNQLSVTHKRPEKPDPYYYRLSTGQIVTKFASNVCSSCICVPCTYSQISESRAFPELKYITEQEAGERPDQCLKEVGKLIAKDSAPLLSMQGKNVVEVDHRIKVTERADHFSFYDTANVIERNIKQQEKSLMQMASQQIRDTGQLYYITQSQSTDLNYDDTEV